MPTIKLGDEVTLLGWKDKPIVVVTLNDSEDFCAIDKEGWVYKGPREILHPFKTGKHYDVSSFLKMIGGHG